MKYLFGFNKKKTSSTIERFALRRIADDQEAKLDDLSSEGKQLQKKKTIPSWVAYVALLMMPFGVLFAVTFLFAKDGFQHALQDRGWMFYLGIGLFVVGLSLYIVCRIKNRKFDSDSDVEAYVRKAESTVEELRFELGIPDTSIEMDVIFAAVKEDKNGEEKIDRMPFIQYVNQELDVFVEKGYLCFADNTLVAGVPLDAVGEINEIDKRMPLPQWNKSEDYKSDKYKQYKIDRNQSGLIWIKQYYSVNLTIDGEQYYFYLPNYEIGSFKELIGKQ